MNQELFRASLDGFLLMFGLIAAVGPQNLLVVREGFRGHGYRAATFCTLSDSLLVCAGVLLGGWILEGQIAQVLRFAAICYLAKLGCDAALRGLERQAPKTEARGGGMHELFLVTWLNPHVYLDSLALVGGVALQHGAYRWAVAVGAVGASALWFFGIATVADRGAGRIKPNRLAPLQLLTGAGMLYVAWRLFSETAECL